MWILSSAEIRAADQATIDGLGVPGICLMELAGAGAAKVLWEAARPAPGKPVVVLCGRGNNGGDGYVIARHLANRGLMPRVYLLAPREKVLGDALTNLQVLDHMGIPVVEAHLPQALAGYEQEICSAPVRVDAILGTGLRSEVRGQAAAAISLLNRSNDAFTLSVDLPSGLSADTGQPLGEAVRADATATFGALKRGQLLHPGPWYCGRVTLVDIGIPPARIDALEPGLSLLEEAEVAAMLGPRPSDCHKGDFGRVLVLAGSPHMAGAGLLAAHGAVRAGAGVVTLCTVEEGCAAARARFPSCLTRRRSPGELIDPETGSGGFRAAIIGPGLGLDEPAAQLVRAWVVGCPLPLVVDADALGILARLGVAELLRASTAPRILTPHEGELARMMGSSREEIHRDRVGAVNAAAQAWGTTVLLKGSGTLIAQPKGAVRIVTRGHPAMAAGGSGDVLAGTLAALLGQGLAPRQAAEAGVYLHGLAGELAASEIGPAGLCAEEIADHLPRALAHVLGQPPGTTGMGG